MSRSAELVVLMNDLPDVRTTGPTLRGAIRWPFARLTLHALLLVAACSKIPPNQQSTPQTGSASLPAPAPSATVDGGLQLGLGDIVVLIEQAIVPFHEHCSAKDADLELCARLADDVGHSAQQAIDLVAATAHPKDEPWPRLFKAFRSLREGAALTASGARNRETAVILEGLAKITRATQMVQGSPPQASVVDDGQFEDSHDCPAQFWSLTPWIHPGADEFENREFEQKREETAKRVLDHVYVVSFRNRHASVLDPSPIQLGQYDFKVGTFLISLPSNPTCKITKTGAESTAVGINLTPDGHPLPRRHGSAAPNLLEQLGVRADGGGSLSYSEYHLSYALAVPANEARDLRSKWDATTGSVSADVSFRLLKSREVDTELRAQIVGVRIYTDEKVLLTLADGNARPWERKSRGLPH